VLHGDELGASAHMGEKQEMYEKFLLNNLTGRVNFECMGIH
jgi:hypothetical protein